MKHEPTMDESLLEYADSKETAGGRRAHHRSLKEVEAYVSRNSPPSQHTIVLTKSRLDCPSTKTEYTE